MLRLAWVAGAVCVAYMVLKGANPTGGAVWWFLETSGGRILLCTGLADLAVQIQNKRNGPHANGLNSR